MPNVAIIGASSDRRKFGNKAVRAYVRAGYQVYPVHPTETTIEGLPTFRSVTEIPVESLDRVAFYVPPKVGMTALDDVAKKPTKALYLNPGTDAPEVVAKAESLGLPVITGCAIIAVGVRPGMFPDE